jgi:diguanylate cyclase (GGDEF)-like protein
MMNTDKLKTIISESEEYLIDRILHYAIEHKYAKYTSTLREAWRMSIDGLSKALIKVIDVGGPIPEMSPDDDFTTNEFADFGIMEARKHRSRGVTLVMFLSFMKYYQQAYIDMLLNRKLPQDELVFYSQFIKRTFDIIELGFIAEWTGLSEKKMLDELQGTNREMENEKNKYLTVFESIFDPVILMNKDNKVENLNMKAAESFLDIAASGLTYYSENLAEITFDWLIEDLTAFVQAGLEENFKQITIETKKGPRTYQMKFKKMLDVSEKYRGTVVVLYDITERIDSEEMLQKQHEELEYYAYTDALTGSANRRTGLMTLERELALVRRRDTPLSVCFLDVDGLKRVNDIYGHLEGDDLIISVSSAIRNTVRGVDVVSRIGGDEFLIIFPYCSEINAKKALDRVFDRLAILDKTESKPYQRSFSYGLVEITKDSTLTMNDVIRSADKLMYQDKLLKKQTAGETCREYCEKNYENT